MLFRSHNNDYAGHSINNFFDICGHTPKMMTLPVAKNLFVRGDIASAQQTVRLSLSKKQYNEQILHYKGSLWFNLMKDMGIRGTAPYLHQTRVQFSDPPSTIENPEIQSGRVHMQSDTQELIWNQEPESQAGITIRSPKTKGYIGFVGGQSFDLGDGIRLEIGTTSQDWVNVLLTYQGENEQGHQWLLVATGNHENTGMIWKNEEKNSVGNQWGSGPPLVEPIPFRLTISTDIPNGNNNQTDTAIEFHSLNELAEPEKDLNSLIKVENEKITIDLMDSPQGLWYQIVFPKDNSMNSVSPSKFF